MTEEQKFKRACAEAYELGEQATAVFIEKFGVDAAL